jgi:hypothetical protein
LFEAPVIIDALKQVASIEIDCATPTLRIGRIRSRIKLGDVEPVARRRTVFAVMPLDSQVGGGQKISRVQLALFEGATDLPQRRMQTAARIFSGALRPQHLGQHFARMGATGAQNQVAEEARGFLGGKPRNRVRASGEAQITKKMDLQHAWNCSPVGLSRQLVEDMRADEMRARLRRGESFQKILVEARVVG